MAYSVDLAITGTRNIYYGTHDRSASEEVVFATTNYKPQRHLYSAR